MTPMLASRQLREARGTPVARFADQRFPEDQAEEVIAAPTAPRDRSNAKSSSDAWAEIALLGVGLR